MGTIADLLASPTAIVQPGAIFLGPMEGVEHPKFYVIAGISGNRILACSVLINSQINPFILRRPTLLKLQVQINPADYAFLDHVSFINCASPLKGQLVRFDDPGFTYKGQLCDTDLSIVRNNIKESGLLTEEEITMYQL